MAGADLPACRSWPCWPALPVLAPAASGEDSLAEARRDRARRAAARPWWSRRSPGPGRAGVVCVRLLSIGLVEGHHPVHGRQAWQAWSVLRLLDEARTWLFPLYSSSLTPVWLRALGARVGKDVEASTVLLIPKLTSVSDGAFLADDTLLGGYELGGGWLRIGRVKIGKHAFVGNSGHDGTGSQGAQAGAGRRPVGRPAPHARPRRAPRGSAARRPQLRRDAADGDDSRTYHPPSRLRVARARRRGAAAGAGDRPSPSGSASWCVLELLGRRGRLVGRGRCSSGVVLIVAGAVAAGVTTAAKWLLVGRLTRSEHPLWSWFVWRNELADTFVEVRRRAVVRARGDRDAGPQRLAAVDGRPGRQGRLVRDLLAARGRPGRPARRRDRQRGLRRADPPVPRPGAQHGHRHPAGRGHPRAQQRHPARGRAGAARYGRPGVTGDEGRVGARQDPLDRQPDRPLGRRARTRVPRERPVPGAGRLLPGVRRPLLRRRALRPAPRLQPGGQPARRPRRAARGRRSTDLDQLRLDLHGLTVSKVRVDGDRVAKFSVRARQARGPRASGSSRRATSSACAIGYGGRPAPDARRRRRDGLGGAAPTGSSSPARPTARRRGSRATTGRPTRRRTGSRSPPHRLPRASPTAPWSRGAAARAPRPGSTSRPSRWRPTSPPSRSAATSRVEVPESPVPMTVVLPEGRLDRLRGGVRSAGRDDGVLHPARSAPYPFASLHRRGHRGRAGDPARGAGPVGRSARTS